MSLAIARLLVKERARHGDANAIVDHKNYVADLQRKARDAHLTAFGKDAIGEMFTEFAEVKTPRGTLEYVTWRHEKGGRIMWEGRYLLDGKRISIRKLQLMGLAEKQNRKLRP